MRNYLTNGGGAFNNFGEVVDYLKNNNYAVLVKDCPQFRAFLLKNDGVYTLKIHYLAKDYCSAYYEKQYEFGERLTAKKIVEIETIMDEAVDNYYEPKTETEEKKDMSVKKERKLCVDSTIYEVSELGEAKRKAAKIGADVDEVLLENGKIVAYGGSYYKAYQGWKYNASNKGKIEAYNGMPVEINVKTTTNIKGEYMYGEILDAETLTVKVENGDIYEYRNNPWAKDNPKKYYFSFVNDFYPVPLTYVIEYKERQENDTVVFVNKNDKLYCNSKDEAFGKYEAIKNGFAIMSGMCGVTNIKNELIEGKNEFTYKESEITLSKELKPRKTVKVQIYVA